MAITKIHFATFGGLAILAAIRRVRLSPIHRLAFPLPTHRHWMPDARHS